MDDICRIKKVYSSKGFWGPATHNYAIKPIFALENLINLELAKVLQTILPADKSRFRVLEIGCGWGRYLNYLLQFGIPAENLYGLDLNRSFIDYARKQNSSINFCCSAAHEANLPSAKFDLILCMTLFSSILDSGVRKQIYNNMLKSIAPGGHIIICDINESYSCGKINSQGENITFIRAVSRKEIINALKGNCSILQNINLGISKRVLSLFNSNRVIICLIAAFRLFTTHYLLVLRKKSW